MSTTEGNYVEGQGAVDRERYRKNFDDINWHRPDPRSAEHCPICDFPRDETYHSCWNCGHSFDP